MYTEAVVRKSFLRADGGHSQKLAERAERFWSETVWAGELRLGEIKETSLGLLFLLYALHLVRAFQFRSKSHECTPITLD